MWSIGEEVVIDITINESSSQSLIIYLFIAGVITYILLSGFDKLIEKIQTFSFTFIF